MVERFLRQLCRWTTTIKICDRRLENELPTHSWGRRLEVEVGEGERLRKIKRPEKTHPNRYKKGGRHREWCDNSQTNDQTEWVSDTHSPPPTSHLALLPKTLLYDLLNYGFDLELPFPLILSPTTWSFTFVKLSLSFCLHSSVYQEVGDRPLKSNVVSCP